jgi:hypothetical protein
MSIGADTSWLDALAGRIGTDIAAPFTDSAEPGVEPAQLRALALEALVLRKFIQVQEADIASNVPTTNAARERELIERARTEGLLPEVSTPKPMAGPASSPRRRRLADTRVTYVAAAMVIVAAGVGLWRSMLPPIETLRGTVNGTVHLEARDPPALKRQLTEELTAAGVQVLGYERLGRIGLDAELQQPVSPPVAAILERHHIPVPTDGVLAVEIDAPRHR